jgi:hypothetical protein
MKNLSNWFFASAIALACLINSERAFANFSDCAWPITISPEGSGNVVLPEQTARDWLIPFDTTKNETMTIKGVYPNVRYFSYVVYKADDAKTKTPSGIAGNFFDAQIDPDPGNVNPFRPSQNSVGQRPQGKNYTLTVSRSGTKSGNRIVVSSPFAWVFMRNYVPNADPSQNGNSLLGGVSLPNIMIDGQQLKPCSTINRAVDLKGYLQAIFAVTGPDLNVDEGTPSSDRLWFAPGITPDFVMPNPENKYAGMFPANYQPGRIIVIHGKAPGYSDTFRGAPIWVPAQGFRNVDLRYWSFCNYNFAWPLSLVNCLSDLTTELQGGYYTIVISDDLLRPDWLRPNINWLPWGDVKYPKAVFLRNMLPSGNFQYSVQSAYEPCAYKVSFPLPDRKVIDAAGRCAQGIMGDYYPVAVWCDKSLFDRGGWQACIKRQ